MNELLFVLQYMDEGIYTYSSMSKPNANTITEYTASENAKKAEALCKAKALLIKQHNKGFADGVVQAFKGMGKGDV